MSDRARESDPLRDRLELGIVVGIGTAIGLVTASWTGALATVVTTPPGLVLGVGAFFGGFAVGAAGARSAEDPISLCSTLWAVAVVLQVAGAHGFLAFVALEAAPGAVPWLLVGAGAFLPGGLTVVLAYEGRRRRRLATATEYGRFAARLDPRSRRWLRIAGAFAFVSALFTVLVSSLASTGVATLSVFPFLVAGPLFVVLAGSERTVRIIDRGLVVNASLHDWSKIESVRVREDAIVVHQRGALRGTFKFDRGDVGDEAALRTAFERVGIPVDGASAGTGTDRSDD